MQQINKNVRAYRHQINQSCLRNVLTALPSRYSASGRQPAQLADGSRAAEPLNNLVNKISGLSVHSAYSTTVDRDTQQFSLFDHDHSRDRVYDNRAMDKEPTNQAERIRALRLARNWTVTDLARKVGVTYSGAKKWEDNPLHSIRTEQLQALARVFNVSVSYILFGRGGPQDEQQTEAAEVLAQEELSVPDHQQPSDMKLVTLTKGELELLTLFHKIQTSPQLQSQVIGYVRALVDMAPKPENVETLPRKVG